MAARNWIAITAIAIHSLLVFQTTALAHGDADNDLQFYAEDVAEAALGLIRATPPEQRAQLLRSFDSPARTQGTETDQTPSFCHVLAWCEEGWGLQQCDMSHAQLAAMHRMLSLALSPGGYQTVLAVMNRQRVMAEMEEVSDPDAAQTAADLYPNAQASSIFDLEGLTATPVDQWYPAIGGIGMPPETAIEWPWTPPGMNVRRDQFCHYAIALYGTPGSDRWSLRLEGHHLSINLTFHHDRRWHVHATPLFVGAVPMAVPDDPFEDDDLSAQWKWERGQMMLFAAVHHLRGFWLEAPVKVRNQAFIGADLLPQAPPLVSDTPPPFFVAALDPTVDPASIDRFPTALIPPTKLSPAARWHLKQAVLLYLGVMNTNAAPGYAERLDRALSAPDPVEVAWAGGSLSDSGSHHYSYVAIGPFVMEFWQSNQFSVLHTSAPDGNHVHGMLRDLEFDWVGDDPMRRHHRTHHAKR